MFTIGKKVNGKFEEVVERVKELLNSEGFGILCEIDVKKTLKEKIGVDFDKYVILGACSPKNAFEVLKANKSFGVLLPCNVVVYEMDGEVVVDAVKPTAFATEEIEENARDVEERLKKVIEAI